MKKALLTIGFAVLLIGSIATTFIITRNKTFTEAFDLGKKTGNSQGYKKGKEAGYKQGWQDLANICTNSKIQSGPLKSDCETSVAQTVVQAPDEPQLSNPIHCTTQTFGTYFPITYTDCY